MTTTDKVTHSGCVKPGTTAGMRILDNADLAPKAGMAGQASASRQGQTGQSHGGHVRDLDAPGVHRGIAEDGVVDLPAGAEKGCKDG